MSRLLFPTFAIDLASELIEIDGGTHRLRPKTWSVLLYLVNNPGRIVTKDELLEQVWSGTSVGDDMPRISVGELRSLLGDRSRKSSIIETVHGKGYRFLVKPSSPLEVAKPTLAVFPFRTEDGSVDEQGFDLGELFTEGLTSVLTAYDEVDVAGSGSVLRALQRASTLEQQAQALAVKQVLRGNIQLRKTDKEIVVVAEIVNPATSRIAWRRSFRRPREELVDLQEHIAEEVAEALRMEGQPPSGTIRLLQRPKHASAYHLYLRGLRLQNQYASDKWTKASDCYAEALEIDPDYAPPWTGLAAVALLKANTGTNAAKQLLHEAEEHVHRALELDPDLPEAHCTLGTVEFFKYWNLTEAEQRFRTAITLRPSYSVAYYSYQRLLWACARFSEARMAGQRAFELDPLSPVLVANLGFAELLERQPGAALAIFDDTLEDDTENVMARLGKGIALRDLGDLPGAVRQFELCGKVITGSMIPTLIAHTHGLAGDHPAARRVLATLVSAEANGVPKTHLALVHTGLGELDSAFKMLSEAVDEREQNVLNLVDTTFDPLRRDARFLRLVRRIGLPDAIATTQKEDSYGARSHT